MPLHDYLLVFGRSFLFALATLLPILNPPAVAPIFWTLTEGASSSTRLALAKRVTINVGLMLTVAMVAGNVLLAFFGLSLAIVRIGGGLLVIGSAWRLVNSPDAGVERAARMADSFTPEMAKARAFYPLTFPISCGPGSIAAAITVGASLREPDHIVSLVKLAGSLPGILVTSLTLYVCLRFAAQFLYRLGESGTSVFMRLSAFVLLCLGVQIVWDGVHELLLGVMVEAGAHIATPPAQ
ncbi:antibiotic resistance protein [Bordetella genomosp. 9]|uniref:MarC family protein n=1 Tax=Bordetella genomosp. 9 TaxID=1416803 RepID=UPI000A28E439|nr:MarC family protein [Bordetella genomosp. 9]ARP90898.1 antibiotic resistance protein [Bordetella genomosp. 9]